MASESIGWQQTVPESSAVLYSDGLQSAEPKCKCEAAITIRVHSELAGWCLEGGMFQALPDNFTGCID
jgi:hypothetical protein